MRTAVDIIVEGDPSAPAEVRKALR
jgi:hypothetical protein